MRLNLQTDYALRTLMHLAVNSDRLCTISEISERFGISNNHLMKVANALGRAAIVETVRGRSGGLRLAKPARDIRIGDVVRITEADFAIVECFEGGKAECLIMPSCRLRGALKAACDAFLSVLDEYTLQELVARNAGLKALLREDAA